MNVCRRLEKYVVRGGICTGCGACISLDPDQKAYMNETPLGPVPEFKSVVNDLPSLAWDVCPGKGISYPQLYRDHYGSTPDNWLIGKVIKARTGHAGDESNRLNGASGGILTTTLCYLLDNNYIDAAVVVKQGIPSPERASPIIVNSKEEILHAAQSVYIPVPVLKILPQLEEGKNYAITCLPDQAAALRAMQKRGNPAALRVKYVFGPYTGTALYPEAINCFMRSKGIKKGDEISSLRWRAGEWPGYLEITTESGKVLRSPKVYYNYLIPFFVTQNSLQNIDFGNEFCDLSVGDAWSPAFESQRGGFAVFVTRSNEMEQIVEKMIAEKVLSASEIDPFKASEMHGHMIDFKKRGGYIRNKIRRMMGKQAPDFGMRPDPLTRPRIAVELVIMTIFTICGTRVSRWLLGYIPEWIIGPLFNRLRLVWKATSKPTKRKGLSELTMHEIREPS